MCDNKRETLIMHFATNNELIKLEITLLAADCVYAVLICVYLLLMYAG